MYVFWTVIKEFSLVINIALLLQQLLKVVHIHGITHRIMTVVKCFQYIYLHGFSSFALLFKII